VSLYNFFFAKLEFDSITQYAKISLSFKKGEKSIPVLRSVRVRPHVSLFRESALHLFLVLVAIVQKKKKKWTIWIYLFSSPRDVVY